MTTEKLLRQAEQHISQGEMQKAITTLQQSALAEHKNYRKALTLIASRWSTYQKTQRKGTLSGEQASLEYNRISEALLNLIHDEPEAASRQLQTTSIVVDSSTNKYKVVIIGALLTFVLGIAGKYLTEYFWQDAPKEMLIEYKLTTLTPAGNAADTYILRIYRDFTGEMLLNGVAQKLEKVDNANETFLGFTIKQHGELLQYNGAQSVLNPYDYLEGTIFQNQQVIGQWQATVLK